jgi:hypothetical protein
VASVGPETPVRSTGRKMNLINTCYIINILLLRLLLFKLNNFRMSSNLTNILLPIFVLTLFLMRVSKFVFILMYSLYLFATMFIFILIYLALLMRVGIAYSVADWTTKEYSFDSWQGKEIFLYCIESRLALRCTQLPIQWMQFFYPRIKRSGREVDHSPSTRAEFKKDGAISPLAHTSSWRGA